MLLVLLVLMMASSGCCSKCGAYCCCQRSAGINGGTAAAAAWSQLLLLLLMVMMCNCKALGYSKTAGKTHPACCGPPNACVQARFLKVDIDNEQLQRTVMDHGITGVVSAGCTGAGPVVQCTLRGPQPPAMLDTGSVFAAPDQVFGAMVEFAVANDPCSAFGVS